MTVVPNDGFGRSTRRAAPAGIGAAVRGRIAGWVGHMRRSAAKMAVCRRDAAILEDMPDHLLRDIGLDRGNLQQFVYFGDPARSADPRRRRSAN